MTHQGSNNGSPQFVSSCKPPALATQPPTPPENLFPGGWTLFLGPGTLLGAPTNTVIMDIQGVYGSSDPNTISFTGTIQSSLYWFQYDGFSLPYPFTGTWTSGLWLIKVYETNDPSTNQGSYYIGTSDWYPPGTDTTNGTWTAYDCLGTLDQGVIQYMSTPCCPWPPP